MPWLVLIIALSMWTAWHLGGFDLTRAVTGPDGASTIVPNTFASVDHPYHAARAATLLDTIRDGNLLRWIGSHEGGYPAEFYPLGVPWLTVAVWALLLGTVSVLAAYKLVVIGLLLAPVLAFVALGRSGRVGLPLGGLALVGHLAVPGGSWDGGFTELVVWGLVTNVAGYVAALGFLAALVGLAGQPSRWAFVGTVVLAVAAVGCNTRSTVALVAATVGVVLAVVFERQGGGDNLLPVGRRVALAGVVAVLLSAPILFNSLRFSDQYEFIRYSWYDGLAAYVSASIDAVSWPVAAFGALGLVLGVLGAGSLADRAVAWTLVTYVVATSIFGGLSSEGGLIGQLEATRLMPFQRLLLLYLAASAVIAGIRLLGHNLRARGLVVGLAAGVAATVAVVVIIAPVSAIPGSSPTLPVPETTGVPGFAELEAAVATADATAPAASALLIAGSDIGWHEPMWAPALTSRAVHYDNWLWLWQTWHRADDIRYDGQAIAPASWGEMLSADYLERNGIGAVVAITPQVEALADQSATLDRVPSGGYAVYRVAGEPTIVAAPPGSTVMATWQGGQRVAATVDGDGGELTIHQTWFPRWEATVDGEPTDVRRGPDGQIRLTVPAGTVSVIARYGTDGWDWLFRAMSALGLVALLGITAGWRGRLDAGRLTIRPSPGDPSRSP